MDECVWSNGGMILTGENWSAGRKTLYSVGGRWMDEYGALVEWYWQGKTEVLGENPVTVSLCPPQIPQSVLASISILHSERPATDRISNSTAWQSGQISSKNTQNFIFFLTHNSAHPGTNKPLFIASHERHYSLCGRNASCLYVTSKWYTYLPLWCNPLNPSS